MVPQIIELCLLTYSASSSGWLVESPDVDIPLPVSPLVVRVVTILKVAEVGRTPDVQSGGALPETERDRLVPGSLLDQLSNYRLKIFWNHSKELQFILILKIDISHQFLNF